MITFSMTAVKGFITDTGKQIFRHPMESISFASIGEGVSFTVCVVSCKCIVQTITSLKIIKALPRLLVKMVKKNPSVKDRK